LPGVSILLAITGMYGVTAYTVAQKRFEFALRFALGAQRGTVLGGAARCADGCGYRRGRRRRLSLALTRVLSTLLGKMPAFDAVSYGLPALGVLLWHCGGAAAGFRAAMVEPMQVLRSDE
jgi:putative ABC transport system permease protein